MAGGRKWGGVGQRVQTLVKRWKSSDDLMHIIVTIVNNNVLYTWNLLRE